MINVNTALVWRFVLVGIAIAISPGVAVRETLYVLGLRMRNVRSQVELSPNHMSDYATNRPSGSGLPKAESHQDRRCLLWWEV